MECSESESRQRVIVVGASAGGVEAVRELVAHLPPELFAPVLIVVHVPSSGASYLPAILDRAGPLPAAHAEDGETIAPGRIYVAPANRHLTVKDGKVELTHGPHENHSRPAIDPLFRTAAAEYGPGVIGVILSGALDDGSRGLATVKRAGGTILVQDPEEARVGSMPRAALATGRADFVGPVRTIAGELARLAQESVTPITPKEEDVMPVQESAIKDTIEADLTAQARQEPRSGRNSVYVCPECGGVLWQAGEEETSIFQCHTGHTYSRRNLLALKSQQVEALLWAVVRTLTEKGTLTRELSAEMDEGEERARIETISELDRENKQVLERMLTATPNLTDQGAIVQEAADRKPDRSV